MFIKLNMNYVKQHFNFIDTELRSDGYIISTDLTNNKCKLYVKNSENVFNIIFDCCDELGVFFFITDEQDNIIEKQSLPNIIILHLQYNICISCKENLGKNNPRQYCKKTYCPKQLKLSF